MTLGYAKVMLPFQDVIDAMSLLLKDYTIEFGIEYKTSGSSHTSIKNKPFINKHIRIESIPKFLDQKSEDSKLRYADAPWINSTIESDINRISFDC